MRIHFTFEIADLPLVFETKTCDPAMSQSRKIHLRDDAAKLRVNTLLPRRKRRESILSKHTELTLSIIITHYLNVCTGCSRFISIFNQYLF